jgi:large subunit ribosomal protein L29
VKLKELRDLSTTDLNKNLEEAYQELFNLRFRLSTRQQSNHRELPRVRKQIARIKTILAERELGIR